MKSLSTLQGIFIGGLVFLLPLFFLPVTSDFFSINKLALLVLGTVVVFLLWSLGKFQSRHFVFRTTPFDIPSFLFAAAIVISGFVATTNRLNAFVFPGTATVIVASVVFYFIAVQYLGSGDGISVNSKVRGIVTAWVWGVWTVALLTLLSSIGGFGLMGKVLPLPVWLTDSHFTPMGSVFGTVIFLIVSAPLVFGRAMQALNASEKEGVSAQAIINFVGFVLFVAATSLSIYQVLPGKPNAYTNLPLSIGWSIALETLKKPVSFLLGVGPGDFVEAFNKFRPVEFNLTKVWNLSFSSSSNWYLDLLTVGGILGLGLFVILVLRLRKVFNVARGEGDIVYIKAAMVVLLVVFLFSAATLNLIFAFFTLLALLGVYASRSVGFQFSVSGEGTTVESRGGINVMAILLVIISSLGLLAILGWGGKVYAADMAYRRALNTVAKQGKYKDVMDALAQAINLNKNVDFYRIDFSQISLALVQQIATKKDLTDSDKKDISQLVQSAIEQGKAAVSLNPNRSANWVGLASIYKTLIPLVQGADQFTVQVYQQAIALEPTNPNLRIALGGVFYSLKDYDSAIAAFEVAVVAKPDLANAHYNLAIALRDAGKTERAAAEMQQVLALIPPGTKDYDSVKSALDSLQAVLKQKAEEASASARVNNTGGEQTPLVAPQPAPSPVVSPKLTLPENSKPPASSSAQPQ